MSQLCHNRPWDNNSFGPTANGDLTTCFEDIVLEPAAVWLLLALTPLVVLSYRRSEYNPLAYHSGKARIWWMRAHDFFCGAITGMSILEMVRLQFTHLGIGLLPFVPVGAFISLSINHMGHRTPSLVALVQLLFWTVFAVFDAVKLHTLVRINHAGFKRIGSLYKTSDQITDNIVILALAVFLALMALLTMPVLPSRQGRTQGGQRA